MPDRQSGRSRNKVSSWNRTRYISRPRSDWMPSVAWIFFIRGNRLMKSAFAAGVGTLSPAGKSRSGARAGAANQRVWSARPKAVSGCRWSGSCWILQSSATPRHHRRITREAQRSRQSGMLRPKMHRPQNGCSNFCASHLCSSRLRPSFCDNPQQFCGDSTPSAITSGTEGADLKSFYQGNSPPSADGALRVHDFHFLIG